MVYTEQLTCSRSYWHGRDLHTRPELAMRTAVPVYQPTKSPSGLFARTNMDRESRNVCAIIDPDSISVL